MSQKKKNDLDVVTENCCSVYLGHRFLGIMWAAFAKQVTVKTTLPLGSRFIKM